MLRTLQMPLVFILVSDSKLPIFLCNYIGSTGECHRCKANEIMQHLDTLPILGPLHKKHDF